MAWVPTTDFEEEIVNLQPDHDFIFGRLSDPNAPPFYPRPQEHLNRVAEQRREERPNTPQSSKLKLIAKIQRIAGTKPLGEQPTVEDWDTNENLVRETVALMRHVGFGPGLDAGLDEACTIATHPITEDVKINRNGRKEIPIFFSEKFFELKPRQLSSSGSPTELANGDNVFDVSTTSPRNHIASGSSKKETDVPNTNDLEPTKYERKSSPKKSRGRGRRDSTCSSLSSYQSSDISEATNSTTVMSSDPMTTPRSVLEPNTSPTKYVRNPSTVKGYGRGRRGSSCSSYSSYKSSDISGGSSIATSSDKDRSLNATKNSFQSAVYDQETEGDTDSYETANNLSGSRQSQKAHKDKRTENKDNWPALGDGAKSWRNRSKTATEAGGSTSHVQQNWRAVVESKDKEQNWRAVVASKDNEQTNIRKNSTQFCSPKALYYKKRHASKK